MAIISVRTDNRNAAQGLSLWFPMDQDGRLVQQNMKSYQNLSWAHDTGWDQVLQALYPQ